MSELFLRTLANLPEIITKNATGIITRALADAQHCIASDPQLGPTSFPALLLGASKEDLTREFVPALSTAMQDLRKTRPDANALGLSLASDEPEAGGPEDDFKASAAAHGTLKARAGKGYNVGVEACRWEVFSSALEAAFSKLALEPEQRKPLLRACRVGMDLELQRLYRKLESV